VFTKHTKTVVDLLRKKIDESDRTIDIQKLFYNYTLESIGEIGFGVELGCLTEDASPFSNAFDTAQNLSFSRFFDPMWKLSRLTGFGKNERELKDALAVVNDFSRKVIAERKAEIKKLGLLHGGRADLLSLFIEAGESNHSSREISDQFLRDIIVNMIIAGRDTTAITLTWATYLISQHPWVEGKLVEEIERASKETGGSIHFGDLGAGKMPFLHGVISEALRLYPPIPFEPKFCVEEDILPDGTLVPAGCEVQYNPYVQNRDGDLWEKPLEYNPERWIDDEGHSISVSPYVFPVFQAGPRICLGQRMAFLEAKLLLTRLVPKYHFSLETGTVVKPNNLSMTLPVLDSLPMVVSKRTREEGLTET